MSSRNYFILSKLPVLEGLGSTPSLSVQELLADIIELDRAFQLSKVICCADDILKRRVGDANEEAADTSSLFTYPDSYSDDEESYSAANLELCVEERDFARFLKYGLFVAEREKSSFLENYIRFEITLRNALVRYRAQQLSVDPEIHQLMRDMEQDDMDLDRLLSKFAEIESPAERLLFVEEIRWEWLCNNDSWFTFSDEEIVAYAAKLLLLNRWQQGVQRKPYAKQCLSQYGIDNDF